MPLLNFGAPRVRSGTMSWRTTA